MSGVLSAFFFPHDQSYEWLEALGISGAAAPLTLYGLAAMDCALGVALLIGYRLLQVITVQIFVMVGYLVVISFGLPEFWLHPFGPLLKNIPMLAASLILMVMEEEKP
jgi:DoxX-like family